MTTRSLMKVESIAECSILQYFQPALSNNRSWKPFLVFFESGCFTQVLITCMLIALFIYSVIHVLTLCMLGNFSCFCCQQEHYKSVKRFRSRSRLICWSCSGSKLFAKVISRQQKSLLARNHCQLKVSLE